MKRRSEILKGIERGEKAAAEGITISHSEARYQMSKWLKDPNAETRSALAESEDIEQLERVGSINELF